MSLVSVYVKREGWEKYSYKDVGRAVGSCGTTLDEFDGTLLDTGHGCAAYDVAIGVPIGDKSLAFRMLRSVNEVERLIQK